MHFGFLNVLKPAGLTSQQVVQRVKKKTGKIKIGHTGTLDPLATGVLPLCLGPATRLAEYVSNMGKKYRAQLQLGIETDTYDREGSVIAETTASHITGEMIVLALQTFEGQIMQVPPMFSAIKRQGKPLYELARQGIVVEREARPVEIYQIKLAKIEQLGSDHPLVEIEVHCSKGTYIRSLVHDLGQKLGTGAVMTALERTEVGIFNLKNGLALEELEEMDGDQIKDYLFSVEQVFPDWPVVIVSAEEARKVENGNRINLPYTKTFPDQAERILLCNQQGRLLAVAKSIENGHLQPVIVFREG
ncbi:MULTISPECIES: tRNA pseudouridine(55) synthase TruB [unclassified Carboxydocella]|uniref:tRNA pseudouridine(55) synthase TruB n=1 Tax=unclassified Carboxydocella TaxID=2685367 RepID=UPI0009ACE0A7|nr:MULTISPECIES: tRNA pseudouridine(55) synthase TruB [unclassified Carboxydocella]AVX31136.1 tRNA pseudouridine synthase B [Carboxydocella thermautotrophica]GAW28246.1 tRNA pseudouridine(55) synthase [Carboxydocella sp. ULO1]GAW30721.1 tRNA pseudouridine(55) synthase [Carboxydocella sp. JDF658]